MSSIGPINALYPMPTAVAGATVNGRPNFLFIADVGILNRGTYLMGRIVLLFLCLLLFGCATKQTNPEVVLQETNRVEGISFETGKAKAAVMNVIMEIVMDDGFDVDPITDETGNIVCNPRFMLSGILLEKTEGKNWNIQSKRSTSNYQVYLSAHVSDRGAVQLKAVVLEPGLGKSVDYPKSEKLAEYYEKAIKKKLRIPAAK